jgi:hypothetical protein
MSDVLSYAAPLAYWNYSTQEEGPRTLFEVMGVMARIPGCPTMPGGSVLLMHGPSSHLQ